MSEQDAALHAFEEWWSITGSKQLAAQRNHGGCEYSAFVAGAEWQRERDACVVEQYYCGYDGVATRVGHHYVGAMENVAEHVRSGEGKDWQTINSTVGGHA